MDKAAIPLAPFKVAEAAMEIGSIGEGFFSTKSTTTSELASGTMRGGMEKAGVDAAEEEDSHSRP